MPVLANEKRQMSYKYDMIYFQEVAHVSKLVKAFEVGISHVLCLNSKLCTQVSQ